ncbi:MAG: CbiX/SirB N-terminal domain-containing protein [Nocardioidaceae bacterium]|nr:CbiX/SirB N-terminal domain-containing protein [Nocardioidaceae bacterium]
MTPRPVLVACAHGTRNAVGAGTVHDLVEAVRAAAPDLAVREAFVDVQQPEVDDVVAGCEQPAVVVPLLLTAGFHVHVDIARAIEGRDAVRTDPLGCDPALMAVLVDRLRAAGSRPGDAVVLAAAGSSDPRSKREVGRAAHLLGKLLGGPVRVGYVASGAPTVTQQVASLRSQWPQARVAVAAYLLAPGIFWNRLHDAGADVVSDPLLLPGTPPDPRLVDLVLRRHAEGATALASAGGTSLPSAI